MFFQLSQLFSSQTGQLGVHFFVVLTQYGEAVATPNKATISVAGKITGVDTEHVYGVTGGAMTSDESVPGPIYLQGDHSDIDYRNMVLTPILK